MERWKDIQGYEGKYKVSNTGKIKSSVTGLERKQRTHYKSGYSMVDLKSPGNCKTVNVHRVVAAHFLKNKKGETAQVNHKSGDKSNASIEELEWMTPSENSRHSHDTGLYGRYSVKKHLRKKKNGVSVIKQHKRAKNGKGKKH